MVTTKGTRRVKNTLASDLVVAGVGEWKGGETKSFNDDTLVASLLRTEYYVEMTAENEETVKPRRK